MCSLKEKSHARCLVEAAAWRVHLIEAEQANVPGFEMWLAVDARHRAVWDQVQRPWGLIENARATAGVLDLRSRVLSRTHAGLRSRLRPWYAASATLRFGPRVALGIACALVLTVASALWWNRADVYQTGPRERLSIVLDDGSRVELDSSTRLRVRYSSQARALSLTRGQARFLVAHDVERPFSVTAANREILATGTDFGVDLLGPTLYVTLFEGRVLVLPRNDAQARSAATKLEAGERLEVSRAGATRIAPVNRESATAWQSRQIVFDDEPLATAVERINRYSTDRLILADRQIGVLRISGVFRTDDLAGFVDTLTRYLPVNSERRRNAILLRARHFSPPPPRRARAGAPLEGG